MANTKLQMSIHCRDCGDEYLINVTQKEWDKYADKLMNIDDTSIPEIFPKLAQHEIEFIASRTCNECQNKKLKKAS